jgi:hypothetical protein
VFLREMFYSGGMLVTRLIFGACTFALAFSAAAEARPMDTYNTIVVRNPFGLKEPPPPVVKDTNPPAQPPKKEDFYLTGISTIGNPKRPKAYLLAKDASKKDYDQKYYSLTVGDSQGDVKLQEIDSKGRRVKIEYLGEEKWLSMKDNGVPAPAGAPAGGPMQPGMVAPPGGVAAPIPLPLPNGGGAVAQPISYPNAGNNNRRPIRTAGYGSTAGNFGAVTPDGPQTDADVLKQIITMKQGEKAGIPIVSTPTVDPSTGNPAPVPTTPSRGGIPPGYVVPSPPIPQLPY